MTLTDKELADAVQKIAELDARRTQLENTLHVVYQEARGTLAHRCANDAVHSVNYEASRIFPRAASIIHQLWNERHAMEAKLNSDELVEKVAKIISGAPFPSSKSLNKARAAIAAIKQEIL